jgi:glycosyltransferase involved in cell wall biosynthesis
MKFSVVILTYNEEVNIQDCINSVKSLSDDIVVLDSYSTDETAFIAESEGAKVIKNHFEGYATQRNFALSNIDYQYEWLLMIDADERLSDTLIDELASLLEKDLVGYSMLNCRRHDYFMGRWLKHSSGYPTWFARAFKVGECSVVREINEEYQSSGKTFSLTEHLDHYSFSKGTSEWYLKHNTYSSMEAELIYKKSNIFNFKDLFVRDFSLRRKAQKALIYSLPFRPVLVFFIFYIYKRGFMDGKAGFYFCLMKFVYEIMISTKVVELKTSSIGEQRNGK